MADLHINLNGLQLKNPIMIASSPLTARLDLLEQAEENGAAAVCIKHAMMQQRFRARPRWYYNRDIGIVVSGDPRLEPEVAAELIRQAKEKTNLTVVSNLSGAPGELESWGKIAHMMEQAGADAVDLNFICPNLLAADSRLADQGSNLGSSPEGCAMVVRQVKKDCGVPVIMKLSTESGKMPQVVRACMEAGADIPNIHAGYRAAPGIEQGEDRLRPDHDDRCRPVLRVDHDRPRKHQPADDRCVLRDLLRGALCASRDRLHLPKKLRTASDHCDGRRNDRRHHAVDGGPGRRTDVPAGGTCRSDPAFACHYAGRIPAQDAV